MATDRMTVKITPNDRGNPMTSTEHRSFQRSRDRASRNADEEHRIVGAGAPGIRASLSHRRTCGDVAAWPGDSSAAGERRTRRHQDSPWTQEGAHDLFGAGIGGSTNPHPPAQQPLDWCPTAGMVSPRSRLVIRDSDGRYICVSAARSSTQTDRVVMGTHTISFRRFTGCSLNPARWNLAASCRHPLTSFAAPESHALF